MYILPEVCAELKIKKDKADMIIFPIANKYPPLVSIIMPAPDMHAWTDDEAAIIILNDDIFNPDILITYNEGQIADEVNKDNIL